MLTAVLFGAMAVAQNSSFAPDFAEAQVAAGRMFKLFDLVPKIDAYSTEGYKPVSKLTKQMPLTRESVTIRKRQR